MVEVKNNMTANTYTSLQGLFKNKSVDQYKEADNEKKKRVKKKGSFKRLKEWMK
jgi:hypothetical protein